MSLKAHVKPITYLKNRTARLVHDVAASGHPVTITQNGEAKVVVMDVETYDRWRAAFALLKLAALGEKDIAAGRAVRHARALQRAAAVIDDLDRGTGGG